MSFIKSTGVITDIALTVPNLTGGTNGRVVRINGSNTVTDASNTDTPVQLNALLFKQGNIYYAGGLITGLSSLSAGSPYFLNTTGVITSTPPTPTSSVRVVFIGFAINTTDLVFRPGTPISGV